MLEGIAFGMEVYRTYHVYKKAHSKRKRFIIAPCRGGFCIKERNEFNYLPLMHKVKGQYKRLTFKTADEAEEYLKWKKSNDS